MFIQILYVSRIFGHLILFVFWRKKKGGIASLTFLFGFITKYPSREIHQKDHHRQ